MQRRAQTPKVGSGEIRFMTSLRIRQLQSTRDRYHYCQSNCVIELIPESSAMKEKRRGVRWVVPSLNPRRASLRYRCLYPMAALQSRGKGYAQIYDAGESLAPRTSVVFDRLDAIPK
jgi:hypothetical protein